MATHVNSNGKITRLELTDHSKIKSESLLTRGFRRLRRDRLTLFALAVLLVFVGLSLAAPFITGNVLHVDPNATSPRDRLLPPGTEGHLLGTDQLGRDHLGRLLHGGRVSLAIGFFSAVTILVIGLVVGMATGYFGGLVDDLVNWVITTLDALPALYLLIAVSALLRPSPGSLILVIAITGWTGAARLVRGQTIQIRNLDYVMAARALGASPWRIMFSHILPNLISVLAISLAIGIGGVILAEATLSFLSLGVQEPTPTWGNMLTDARSYFNRAAYLMIGPGLLISITVLCLYIIGDGIRDAFDPQAVD
ncbi:MAG: ABC transporter permease [bacterium]|nr:ABC transporter permease [bacterium]